MVGFFKKVFKFLASVKLAVPLMTVIIFVVAYGTIVESNYNAEMAKLKVYQTSGFGLLMVLLWINILFAALSRWPWKKRHLGFLITHLGLLILLIGGAVTGYFGIDGTVRLLEGEEGNSVVLPDLVFGISSGGNFGYTFYPIKKTLQPRNKEAFREVNESLSSVVTIEEALPFVERRTAFSGDSSSGTGPVVVQFNIKSPFFDVDQTLHSENQKSLQMGPAQFVLEEVGTASGSVSKPRLASVASPKQAAGSWLLIKRKSSGAELKRLAVTAKAAGATLEVAGVQVKVNRLFARAQVGAGGMVENPDGTMNPAIEVNLTRGEETLRDVVFAKFPGFSLLTENKFDLSFEYLADLGSAGSASVAAGASSNANVNSNANANVNASESASANPDASSNSSFNSSSSMASDSESSTVGTTNIVKFTYDRSTTDQVQVSLFKKNEKVLERKIKVGETIVTPWMGIQVNIKGLYWNAKMNNEVLPIEPPLKAQMLPPSALLLSPALAAPADQQWLMEGEESSIVVNDKPYGLYFGPKVISLPFKLKLLEFKKIDYPGTSMAKSFESKVIVNGDGMAIGRQVTISMNEPLEYQGYTVYQSSYEELPNGKYASVFSVNKDPGRFLKYLGSLILCLGIIVFTLMRSRWYLKRVKA